MTAYFQQDPIEEHFGHQRNHIGCAYRVTPLQFSQTERKLTNLSTLTGSNRCNTKREKKSILDWNELPLATLTKDQIDETVSVSLSNFNILKDHDYAKPFEDEKENNKEVSDNMDLVEMDPSTQSTLVYIRGSIIRKILNHSNCPACINKLIQNVKETNTTAYLVQMDFSGNSLLEPNEHLMLFFHIQLTAYLTLKKSVKEISSNQNVLQKLCSESTEILKAKQFSAPFCPDHKDVCTKMMVQSTMRTFLKAYIHEVNELFVKENNYNSSQKNRKLLTLSAK
jgi:hypothetical protein